VEASSIRDNGKIRKLTNDIERCERYIKHLENNLVSCEDEIKRLKIVHKAIRYEFDKCLDHLELKEEALVAQDARIIKLEATIDELKEQILELSLFQNLSNKMADQQSTSLPDLFQNIATGLDQTERSVRGDTSIDPIITINGIRIALLSVRGIIQTIQQAYTTKQAQCDQYQAQRDQYQNMLNTANEQITRLTNNGQRRVQELLQERNNAQRERDDARDESRNFQLLYQRNAHHLQQSRADKGLLEYNRDRLIERYEKWKDKTHFERQNILNLQQQIFALQNNPLNMATMVDVNKMLTSQLAVLPYYDGQEDPDSYYAKLRNINESARPLQVANFNAAARCNVMKGKMTGRFHPVPAQNPYNGNANINNEAEFSNWLKGKYQEVIVGTTRDAQKALANEKFTPMDTVDTYEKRIKPYTLGMPYADVLPYLLEHMPQYMEIRLRQANPGNLDAFFTDLRKIWLESRGRNLEQPTHLEQPTSTPGYIVNLPGQAVKDDFKLRLARDLQYAGIATDDVTLERFIYDELTKRLTKSGYHIRRNPFEPKNTYATKKGIKKVTKVI
jgi:hypothetical protein